MTRQGKAWSTRAVLVILACMVVATALAGCPGKTPAGDDATTGSTAGMSPAPISRGETPGPNSGRGSGSEKDVSMKIFTEQCEQCHSIGSRGKKDGIPLAGIGARRAQAWIEAKIRHPEKTNPQTAMPLFPPDRITESDLHLLGHYLASLK